MLCPCILTVRQASGWRELRNTVGMILTGEDRLVGQSLSQCPIVHHKSHMDGRRVKPGFPVRCRRLTASAMARPSQRKKLIWAILHLIFYFRQSIASWRIPHFDCLSFSYEQQVDDNYGALVEWSWQGKTAVPETNLSFIVNNRFSAYCAVNTICLRYRN